MDYKIKRFFIKLAITVIGILLIGIIIYLWMVSQFGEYWGMWATIATYLALIFVVLAIWYDRWERRHPRQNRHYEPQERYYEQPSPHKQTFSERLILGPSRPSSPPSQVNVNIRVGDRKPRYPRTIGDDPMNPLNYTGETQRNLDRFVKRAYKQRGHIDVVDNWGYLGKKKRRR
jgi:uncharacterized membrane protein